VCVGLVDAVTVIETLPIRLAGELDIATTATLLALGDLCHPGETVTIDMSGVTFIDAAALGAIVHLRNDVIAAGATLRLAALPAHIARIFVVAGLATIL
jgi:anti-sigma B factor antagonist